MKNIVLNIPHSSINGVFDCELGGWAYNPNFVNDCVNKWTDWYTNFIFLGLSRLDNVQTVTFSYSRFVCDVERLKNDILEEKGQGIIYTEFDGYKRNELNEEQKDKLIKLWENHQEELKSHIKSDDTILIDCHSFPSDLYDCDICIGYNNDWSYDEKIVNGIVKIFKNRGYKVEINKPYSNSITPKSEFKYKSVMIEVNKRVYMNEKTMKLERDTKKWIRWDGTLKEIHKFLVNNNG